MSIARQGDRQFGLTIAAACAVLCGVGWLLTGRISPVIVSVGVVFGLFALFLPGALMPVNRVWTALIHRIGAFLSLIVLGIAYVILIIPTALILRLLGRDSMQRGYDSNLSSYFLRPTRKMDAETMRDLF